MAHGGFQDLPRTTVSDKVLPDKAFDIAKNPRYDVYERGVASMVYEFFDKNSLLLTDKSAMGGGIKNKNM